MKVSLYGDDPVKLAVELANDPPADAAELSRRCSEAGLVIERAVTAADVSATRRFLQAWTEIVDARESGERAELLNQQLARSASHPRLTDHAGTGWHLHYRETGMPTGAVLEAMISVATAFHLTERGMHRLGRCAAPDCERIFADMSPTGRQRYCGQACANRDAVRRHRARNNE